MSIDEVDPLPLWYQNLDVIVTLMETLDTDPELVSGVYRWRVDGRTIGISENGTWVEYEVTPPNASFRQGHLPFRGAPRATPAMDRGARQHPRSPCQHRRTIYRGAKLRSWMDAQRMRYRDGTLAPDQIDVLEALPGWWWQSAAPRGRPGR